MRRRFTIQLCHGSLGRFAQRRLEAIAGIMAKHGAYAEVRIRLEDPDFVNYLTLALRNEVTLVKVPNTGAFSGSPLQWDAAKTTAYIHEVIRRQRICERGVNRVEPLREAPGQREHIAMLRRADDSLDRAFGARRVSAASKPSSAGNLRPVEEAHRASRRPRKPIKRR